MHDVLFLVKQQSLGLLVALSVFIGLAPGALAEHPDAGGKPRLDPTLISYQPHPGIEGRFTVAGSNTMYPLMTRLASEFKRYYPDVKIGVEGQGSKSVYGESSGSGAFWEMIQNKSVYRRGDGSDDGHHVSMQVHIMASSRRLAPEEIRTFTSRYGYEPTEIPIALEALALYVNRANPLEGLTLDQIDAIFSQNRLRGASDDIATWGQLGLPGEWQNAPLRLYGRDQKSGTRAFVRERVLLNGEFKPTIKEMVGSATLVVEVGRDPFGIGYSGIGYETSSVRALPLAPKTGMPLIAPSADSATDGTYPLTRHLYLYVNRSPNSSTNPAVIEFIKFINTREGQETIIKSGVYALPLRQIQENLALLADGNILADNHRRSQ